ncbi:MULTISPECIES: beta-galactosidase [Micromonospora]|uniref:Beta-galactosidase n=1 Tax=Micromonospora solifontis TaxID=2487138 RepID=A0ABX9WFX1_9ACTN|nr:MULTISPECIES: beta-galactosidase [Micromonospora]NES13824.1 beta-galactosidase [Micromonospora sp. PPF5-17B]NES37084.1 beta-galactosidase [Micromonospora solifontis]NES58345.1 beta-galactosidase [Micromonospora sp. PPF5-6]RNL98754.1 beta-galactosidase [Micromonospora solifontis]
MSLPGAAKVGFGGDYNPEQWPEPVWHQDYRLFDLARIDTVTLGVFHWALLQPAPDGYDFSLLDRIVERAAAEGRRICLATGTAAHPAWLARAHPEVTRVDFEGRRHRFGQRHNSCPSSPVFRRLSAELARRIAARYAGNPAVVAWHVGNEYGGACYCERCADGFRDWLRDRYGTLDALNDAWCTTFWSHTFTDWAQVEPPSALTEHWRGPDHTAFQGITLDYLRFTSDALLANFLDEKAAIRESSPDLPVTTNFMGMYRPIDYHRWAPHLDFASWDNYPPDDSSPAWMALSHDLIRGLKDGQPFWLMEQTPSHTACRDVNPLKRPGVMRLWSWQAVAHGADAVLFFQLRAARGACEKYHGAVIGHAGRSDTRVFREVAALGAELDRLGDATLGARTPARVALLFDWDSWWALEISDGPNRLVRYQQVVSAYHRALWDAGVDVDVLPVTAALSRYQVVLAPVLHLVKGDLADRLAEVAARGGSVLTTFLSGRVDEHDNAFLADVPGPLAALTGVRVDEWDARGPEFVNPVLLADGVDRVEVASRLVFELVIPQGAEVVGRYRADFYAGTPAVTRNRFGAGDGWYVAAGLDQEGVSWVVRRVLDRHGLIGPYADVPELESGVRVTPDGVRLRFLLNHRAEPVEVAAAAGGVDLLTGDRVEGGQPIRLDPYGVMVVREDGSA